MLGGIPLHARPENSSQNPLKHLCICIYTMYIYIYLSIHSYREGYDEESHGKEGEQGNGNWDGIGV